MTIGSPKQLFARANGLSFNPNLFPPEMHQISGGFGWRIVCVVNVVITSMRG